MTTALHVLEPERPLSRDDLLELVQTWQRRLRLDRWDIRIEWEQTLADDDAYAEIRYDDWYDIATIKLAAGYATWPHAKANQIIAHELLHVVCRDMDEAVKAAKLVMPEQTHLLFASRYEHENEGVVDRLATILAELAGVV